MALQKRGLGRGLEALLADFSGLAKSKQVPPVVLKELDEQAAIAAALIEGIEREKLNLLEEAEALQKLIAEFESIIRADLP
jgi:ParB-like chromosome segregation protein Spo0J